MSIQTALTRITNAKAAIKAAVEGKGVTVPDATLLDGMAALIESIEAGGGTISGKKFISGEITFSETELQFLTIVLALFLSHLSFLQLGQPLLRIILER